MPEVQALNIVDRIVEFEKLDFHFKSSSWKRQRFRWNFQLELGIYLLIRSSYTLQRFRLESGTTMYTVHCTALISGIQKVLSLGSSTSLPTNQWACSWTVFCTTWAQVYCNGLLQRFSMQEVFAERSKFHEICWSAKNSTFRTIRLYSLLSVCRTRCVWLGITAFPQKAVLFAAGEPLKFGNKSRKTRKAYLIKLIF